MANRFGDQELNRFGDTVAAPPPPPPPAEPTPLAKFRDAVAENLGLKAVRDLDEGIDALWKQFTTGKKDPAKIAKAGETLTSLAQGITGEPARISQELRAFQDTLARGDISGAAYHLGGAVPFLGAPAQQVAQDLAQGEYSTAAGHAVGLALPFSKPIAEAGIVRAGKTAGPAVRTTAETVQRVAGPTGTAVGGAVREVARSVPDIAGGALEGGMYGAIGGPHGVAIGAKVGAMRAAKKAAVRGAREALKARAAAATESLRRPPAPAPEPGVPPVIPPERQLAAPPDVIVTPAPEAPPDTSFVRGVPAQYPEVIPPYMRSRPEVEAAALELKQAMQESGTVERGAPPVTAPEPEIPTAASVRAADQLAQTLHEHGISSQDALLLDPSDWAQLTGPDAPPSLTRDAIVRLGELERAAQRQPTAEALRKEMGLAEGEMRPPAAEAKPAPSASETRVAKLGKLLADSKLEISEIERIATTPDARRLIEDLALREGLARPAAGEIPQIIERVRKLRATPETPGPEVPKKPPERAGTPVAEAEARAAAERKSKRRKKAR